MKVEVLCVGHATWDLAMQMDGFPAENSKVQTEALVESGGGPAANAAWLLGRWGVPVAMAGVVGQDDYGQRILEEFQAAGVDCRLLEARPGFSTPVSFILANRANGSRTVINRKMPGAPWALAAAELVPCAPRILLFDGHEMSASLAAMAAFPTALKVLDAGSLREGTRTLASQVDYLVCSERFATQILGGEIGRANWKTEVACLRERNGKTAVITLGERGLVFDDGHHQGWLEALPVRAVDTTAAGDLFHGAFVYGLLQGWELDEVLRLANTAAGLSVQRPGGRPSAPALVEVLDYLKSHA